MGNAVVRINGRAYESQRVLADGGFATVYEVRRDGQRLALKWIRGVADSEQLERLLLEIQVQRKLQHPNAMRLLDAEVRRRDEDRPGPLMRKKERSDAAPLSSSSASSLQWHTPYSENGGGGVAMKEVLMLFPLYPRGSLQMYLEECVAQQRAAFSEPECLRIFELVVEAVLELQARGYAHRDIKPGNILLTSTEPVEPVLVDFGSISPIPTVIRSARDAMRLYEEAAQFSSAPYRAPELWEAYSIHSMRRQLDGRTDVWSLGCLLFTMAFGPYSPFESPTEGVRQLAIFSGSVVFPPRNTRFGVSFSAAFVSLIKWMLTTDPSERPGVQDVLEHVVALRRGEALTPPSSMQYIPSSVTRKLSFQSQSSDNTWADFSIFGTSQPNSAQSTTSTLASIPVATLREHRRAASRRRSSSTSQATTLGPRAVARAPSSSVIPRSAPFTADPQRRRLSLKGKQLLSEALAAPFGH
ncbi:hypothetical protein P43SY_008023 [Pythium insidiosum]|uniref:non-specific serine/threonine protein kinase n=1 Tax=Pythium insidiosum TaxID=114742 RepID=A0AAD5M966_PYTIN|nr:hypothetical protein P43SY_008023 [Pythium insidiosum]